MKNFSGILLFLLLLTLVSCGKDLLKSKVSSTQSALGSSKECSGYVPSTPVCAFLPDDNLNHDYFSKDFAECLGAQVQFEGHCDCNSNPSPVCTEEAGSISECEARSKKFTITKYMPCKAVGL